MIPILFWILQVLKCVRWTDFPDALKVAIFAYLAKHNYNKVHIGYYRRYHPAEIPLVVILGYTVGAHDAVVVEHFDTLTAKSTVIYVVIFSLTFALGAHFNVSVVFKFWH